MSGVWREEENPESYGGGKYGRNIPYNPVPSAFGDTFDGRRRITIQENYRDLKAIRTYLFRLTIIGLFLFLVSVAAITALLYFSFQVAAHRETLENIEEQTEQALIFLMQVLNSTSEVTKDITTVYNRAKMAHRRSVGLITQEEYETYLDGNGINVPAAAEDPFANENHDNETYATHFMHILLRSLPLEDEDKMIVRFRNFFDGLDSAMYMLSEANRTRIIQNTSLIEKKINDILYADRSRQLAMKMSSIVSEAMDHSHEIVNKLLATNHSIGKVLHRLNELSKTEMVDLLLKNKHDALRGVGHLGEEAYEALHMLTQFLKSDEGHELIGNAEDIVDALNKFHTAKRATQLLSMMLNLGSRTLNLEIEDEEEVVQSKHEGNMQEEKEIEEQIEPSRRTRNTPERKAQPEKNRRRSSFNMN